MLGSGLPNPFLREALAQTIGDRYLVVLFLDGGNDGLNTVTPIQNGTSGALRDAYHNARSSNAATGGIRLADSDLLYVGDDADTDTPIGLHPAFGHGNNGGLWGLYNQGKVAVLQGCGYPLPDLSHDSSRKKWERADPLNVGDGTGWVGRYLAANYGLLDIPAVAVRGGIPGEFAQNATGVLAVSTLAGFTFPYHSTSSSYATENTSRNVAFQALCDTALASGQSTLEFAGQVGSSILSSTQIYPALNTDYVNDPNRAIFNPVYAAPPQYAGQNVSSQLARDLREVAKGIFGVENGKVDSRFFEVRTGGFDTHSNQGGAVGAQALLHARISFALETFYADLEDMGTADKTTTIIYSEFSRRIRQNDSGTDHGSQGPVFVIGGSVNGGLYGKHPDINEGALASSGNTFYIQGPANTPYRSLDIRDIYGTIMKHWLNMPASQVAALLPLDTGSSSTRWTTADFDLPLFV
jgi:uncharacterized protein (DUF1501 family)